MVHRRLVRSAVALGSMIGLATSSLPAEAQTIKTPNGHLDYRVELEPHMALSIFRRGLVEWKGGRGKDYFGTPGVGGGFRASIELADPAFIKKLNNTVGITFGVDVTSCEPCGSGASLFFPVALQWNFFFSEEWSAFGEIGPMIRTDAFDEVLPDLYGTAGGRLFLGDTVSLTARIGYPFFTFGVSLFL